MKYKLKTRLFAALALSGVSFYWPASGVLAQEDDFGFIRAAEPTRQDDQELNVPPINRANARGTQVLPPIVSGRSSSSGLTPNASAAMGRLPIEVRTIGQAPNARTASAPVPFAASNVFNGAYVESGSAKVGYAQHVSPTGTQEQAATRQVAFNGPSGVANQAPMVSGIQAQRDVPPIVEGAQSATQSATQSAARHFVPQIVRPIEQNEMPPILSSVQAAGGSAMPPIVTPKAGLNGLLRPIPATADGGMIQDEFLLSADGGTLNAASQVKPAAAYGASPLLVQEAPPIIGGFDQGSIEPGALPSANGVLVPGDPAVDLPFDGPEDVFPRATPLDSANVESRSVFQNDALLQPATQPRPVTQPRPTYFDPGVHQPATVGGSAAGGCSTCGTSGGSCGCSGSGSAVSGCTSCGENGCFDPAAVESMFNTSGSNAYARQYFSAEALYLNRDDDSINLTNFGTLSDFDGGGGARITVGRRQDSTRGREFQYSGSEALSETINTTSASGAAQTLVTPFGGLTRTNLASFFNATEQEQSAETYFHSLEFNKVKWGWDVIKSYVGLRYLYVDDEYTLFSQSSLGSDNFGNTFPITPERGEFQMAAANHLIGPQIGGELYYDVGYRWSLSGVSRFGLFANFSEVDTRLINDGVQLIDNEDTSVGIAYTYELGLNAKYRLTNQAQFKVGYNFYFWDNLATVSDNLDNNGAGIGISPSFGNSTSDNDSIFLHGLSVGFEIYR